MAKHLCRWVTWIRTSASASVRKFNLHTPRDVYVLATANPGSDAFAGVAATFAAPHVALRAVPKQEQLAKSCLRRAHA